MQRSLENIYEKKPSLVKVEMNSHVERILYEFLATGTFLRNYTTRGKSINGCAPTNSFDNSSFEIGLDAPFVKVEGAQINFNSTRVIGPVAQPGRPITFQGWPKATENTQIVEAHNLLRKYTNTFAEVVGSKPTGPTNTITLTPNSF